MRKNNDLSGPAGAGCPAGAGRHGDPRVKDCRAKACGGRIVPLLLKMCRAVSEQGDLSLGLEALLDYMRADMGVERAMINVHDRETGASSSTNAWA
jgi:Nif-specific regulatory protein